MRTTRLLSLFIFTTFSSPIWAFCGFYVGKSNVDLINKTSQVIIARDQERTVISMQNDYKGDLKEFALVIPVPEILQRGQINVGSQTIFKRLSAYSAPRLVEYFDSNPCNQRELMSFKKQSIKSFAASPVERAPQRAKALGVKIEASYSVGEYDILILSAKQSDGLATWLKENGYKIPKGASRALLPYIRQNMKFFIAKVNLKAQKETGFSKLRPLQFAYESEKFMLPIRLGMINANEAQDLVVYMLTRQGRVESTNYPTIKLPTNIKLPVFIKEENNFADFYEKMFNERVQKKGPRAVFTEYFWDTTFCDPCAANPLSRQELKQAGVFWLNPNKAKPARPTSKQNTSPSSAAPSSAAPSSAANTQAAARSLPPMMILPRPPRQKPVMLTRLRVRYTADSFPEDLMFHETQDRKNYQVRFVLNHAWDGSPKSCSTRSEAYFEKLASRQEEEAKNLAHLTGDDIKEIREKMQLKDKKPGAPWWSDLWGK